MKLYFTGKEKLGYLTGERIQPDEKDPSYSTWEEENAMVMSWLLKFITPDVSASFLLLPTTHDIWVSIQHIYYDKLATLIQSIFSSYGAGDTRRHGRPWHLWQLITRLFWLSGRNLTFLTLHVR